MRRGVENEVRREEENKMRRRGWQNALSLIVATEHRPLEGRLVGLLFYLFREQSFSVLCKDVLILNGKEYNEW